MPHEQHRADGRGGDVDDVVADEDGGQQPVVLLQQACSASAALPLPFSASVFRRVVLAEEKAVSVAEK